MQEYPSVWKYSDGVNIFRWKVFVEGYQPTTLSVKEFFFTLGDVISFTLGMVSLSVDLSQLGRIVKTTSSDYVTVSHIC